MSFFLHSRAAVFCSVPQPNGGIIASPIGCGATRNGFPVKFLANCKTARKLYNWRKYRRRNSPSKEGRRAKTGHQYQGHGCGVCEELASVELASVELTSVSRERY
jgi:hypothetical protein